jgi:L-aspartate oxidase
LSEDLHAVDLLRVVDGRKGVERCSGALLLEHRTGRLLEFNAGLVMLATGGAGQAYRHTTNPDIATGDGIAMAWRAGATLANLEFIQFHPTALYPARERAFLISEAVRGEGAVIRRRNGGDLMAGVHPLGSLAPRDVVARTIDMVLKESGDDYVLLDLAAIPGDEIERRFPGILAECADRGLDIRTDPIPVVPAAHYICGGVVTDEDGRTSIDGLFAAGEVSCTGVHGANRLASNSLLEAVVYSHRAARHVEDELTRAAATDGQPLESTPTRTPQATPPIDSARTTSLRNGLRDLMWEHAGIVRTAERLEAAADRLEELHRETEALGGAHLDTEMIELRNLVDVSRLIVTCARQRHESRGLHFNVDYPYRDNERFLRDTVVSGRDA